MTLWSAEETNILKTNYFDKYKRFNKKVLTKLLPNRSLEEIKTRAQIIGLKDKEYKTQWGKKRLSNYLNKCKHTAYQNRSAAQRVNQFKDIDLNKYKRANNENI